MARGTTLTRLLDMLRAETRTSLNPAHNNQVRDQQVLLLQMTQEWLWDDFDWPHLRVERQQPAQNGQRFYDTPLDVKIDRILEIRLRYGQRWVRLAPGIELEHYRQWDSELDMRSWPISRWRIWEDEQIEVWPIPAMNADPTDKEGYLNVVGIRNLNPLVDANDTSDLDDWLLVLFAAADMLAAAGSKAADLKLEKANKRYAKLRGELMPRRRISLGKADGFGTKDLLRGPPRVHYRTT